jgi:hypothetical protein
LLVQLLAQKLMLLSLLLLASSAITGFPTAFSNPAVACISAFSGVPAAANVITFAGIFAVACFPASDCVVPVPIYAYDDMIRYLSF